jgi:hypothetical protein
MPSKEEIKALVSQMTDDEINQLSDEEYNRLESILSEQQIIEEMPEELKTMAGTAARAIVKNLSNNPDTSVKYLSKKFPNMEFKLGDKDRILIKKPGQDKYNVLDPEGFDIRDIFDIVYDIGSGVAEAAATAAGFGLTAAVGGVPGAMAGGAVAGALSETVRQSLAQLTDLEQDVDPKDIALAAGFGAIIPAGLHGFTSAFKLGSKVVKGAGKTIFNSVFSKANEIAEQARKTIKPGSILFENKVSGSKRSILKQVDKLKGKLAQESEAAITAVDDIAKQLPFGNQIISEKQINEKVREKLILTLGNMGDEGIEKDLKRTLKSLEKSDQGLITIKEAQRRKKLLDKYYKESPSVAKDMARDIRRKELRSEILSAADKMQTGLGNVIDTANQKYSALSAIGGELKSSAKTEAGKGLVTGTDIALGYFAPGLAAGRKAVEIGRMAYPATKAGRALGFIGETGENFADLVSPYTPLISGGAFGSLAGKINKLGGQND